MQIFIGVVITLFFFIWSGFCMWIGPKLTKKIRPEPQQVDEKTKQQIKLREEGFKNIMDYDISVAMQRTVSK